MAERIKVAVIGTGFIGPVHVEALRRLGIEVAGIMGSNLEQTRKKAERLRLPKAYADLDELLAEPGLTAVHVTTPNYLHAPMARAAIAAGKHVVCEKPLAMNAAEGEELLRLAEAAGVVHAVNFNVRFYPLVQDARSRIARGDLGGIYQVYGRYVQDWLLNDTDWNWRLETDLGGEMRVVSDIGSHWLDLAEFLTGQRVTEVCADFATFLPVRKKPTRPLATFAGADPGPGDYEEREIRTEDYAGVLLRFDGGARGSMTVSQVSAGRKNHNAFEINGAKSSLAWNSERVEELWMGRRDKPSEILLKDPNLMSAEGRATAEVPGGHAEGFRDAFKMLYARVYAAIEAGGPPAVPDYPTFADGVRSRRLGDAIQESARQRAWVMVGA
ncbi:MAG: Gfo/Idh/MocA family protein [Thermomicrobiales bacterium]